MNGRTAIRFGLLALAALAAALLAVALRRYPSLLRPDPPTITLLALAGLGLAVAAMAATAGVRADGPLWRAARRDGVRWGVLFGALWVVEMVVANVGYGWGRWAVVPYFAATWSVWLLTAYAGARAARRHRQVWVGTLVGTWSGLVSGLIGLITMQALALTEMPLLLLDPQNLAEFRGAGDLAAAIAGDFLAGGIIHLVVIGLVVGSGLASIGAAVGAALPPAPAVAVPAAGR